MGEISFGKGQYAKLKNLAYQVYLVDRKFSSNKAQRVMKVEVEKYDSEELKNIIYNTLLFPFDVELYNFLADRKFNEDTMLLAAEKFDIPVELVKQKAVEYSKYSFINCVGEGLIDYSVILELSKQLLNDSSEVEKNPEMS